MAHTLIHESRRLLLPFDTVVDALIELDTKRGRWPSNAALVAVAMHDNGHDSGRSVALTIRPAGQEATVERTYPLPAIAAAIVNYCLTMRVPLPRSSTKTIRILPEGIALQLENTLMLHRRHGEAPPAKVVSVAAAEIVAPAAQSPSAAAVEPPAAGPGTPAVEAEAPGSGSEPGPGTEARAPGVNEPPLAPASAPDT